MERMNGIEFKIRILRVGTKAWKVAQEAEMHPSRLSQIINNQVDATREEIRRIETILFKLERGGEYNVCERLTWRENDVPGCMEPDGSIINRCNTSGSWCLCDCFARQATIKVLEKR